MKLFLTAMFALCIMGLLLVGCSSNNDSTTSQKSALKISMVDAPGDYEEVNLEVLDVMIKNSSDTSDNGWVSVGDSTVVGKGKIYNILDLTAGVNLLLTNTLVPSGHLGQVRLLLGTANTVKVDGVTYPLDTPSAQQSGLKLQINQDLVGGANYSFVLDFDADQSIVNTGSNKFILKPVIRVSTVASSGVIKGKIDPMIAFQVQVSVPADGTVISSLANDQGMFQLNGVPAGTYTVTITPDPASGKQPITVDNIVVVNGQATDIGTVSFP